MKRAFVVIGGWLAVSGAGDASAAQVLDVAAPATEQVELGRLLFWDPILSGDMDVACVTCHHPEYAYADGRGLSLGPRAVGLGPNRLDRSGGQIPVVKRNAPTVLNTAFNGVTRRRRRSRGPAGPRAPVDQAAAPMFWDSRTRSLEAQALEPIRALEEMRSSAYPEDAAVDSVVARLRAIPEYVALFHDAFGPVGIEAETLAASLAAFQRSLQAINSPVDRFQRGDSSALTGQQRRGMEEFDAVGCDRCHDGPMFSDFRLHAEGVSENPLLAEPDTSRGRFRFRTPSLRNVALTAPYMHNGMLESLQDVLRFYDNGRSENPNIVSGGGRGADRNTPSLDRNFRRVADMSDRQIEDIVAFLEALTDEGFDRTVPRRVPSGLPPGGHIHP